MRDDFRVGAERIKSILTGIAVGGNRNDQPSQSEYKNLRATLMKNRQIKSMLPNYVTSCREFSEFWAFIQPKFPTYAERRNFIKISFEPLLNWLEKEILSPSAISISEKLENFALDDLHAEWRKALERMISDVEGAITMSRTLLESTLKHILDEAGAQYDDGADLPKLYSVAANILKLSPSQHTEQIYKQSLGGCHSVVQGVGSIRSKLGDAHGRGRSAPKPSQRHAELSVNLAGAMSVFLIQSWKEFKAK